MPRPPTIPALLFTLAALASLPGLLLSTGCRPGPPTLIMTPHERAQTPTLRIGDPAPPIAVSAWIAGQPATSLSGRVHVIEFWATWCGPCIAAMPLLAEAQRRHPESLVAIALTTVDQANTPDRIRSTASRRAAEWGVTSGLRIAIDDRETTARAYRIALRDTALPRSAVIDAHGRLAWWGHPADAAPVIDQVIAGRWDLDAARAQADALASDAARSRAIVQRFLAANRPGDEPARLALTEDACAIPVPHTDGMAPQWWAWRTRVSLLAQLGREADARAVAAHAAELEGIRDQPAALADLVEALPPSSAALRLGLAERAIARAEQLEAAPASNTWEQFLQDAYRQQHAEVFAQTSDAFAHAGQRGRAADLLRRAIDRAPDDPRYVWNKSNLTQRLRALESQ
ncbi:MAG: TlpA family protein disulfide reductase [Phycisphaerales bacterium]|nr:TlpA family protein disulfide reductase [Phycisphaerales bacterium]